MSLIFSTDSSQKIIKNTQLLQKKKLGLHANNYRKKMGENLHQ